MRYVALLLLLGLNACAPLLLGGAAASMGLYSAGELSATRNTSLPDADRASDRALRDLGVTIVQKERDGLGSLYVAKGVEDRKIKVRLRKVFDDVTEISIRVGMIGDEMQSRLILDRIEQNLRSDLYGVQPTLPGDVARTY